MELSPLTTHEIFNEFLSLKALFDMQRPAVIEMTQVATPVKSPDTAMLDVKLAIDMMLAAPEGSVEMSPKSVARKLAKRLVEVKSSETVSADIRTILNAVRNVLMKFSTFFFYQIIFLFKPWYL